jgi:hypothetical protein
VADYQGPVRHHDPMDGDGADDEVVDGGEATMDEAPESISE